MEVVHPTPVPSQLTRRTIVDAVTMRVHPHHHLQSSMLHYPPTSYLLLCIISISLPYVVLVVHMHHILSLLSTRFTSRTVPPIVVTKDPLAWTI